MICTFLRSSSYGTHEMCPLSYFLQYNLGIRTPSGKKASQGNVTHKALELLAWQSYHRTQGNPTFEEETFGELHTEAITPTWATDVAFDYYRDLESHHTWTDKDRRVAHEWTATALTSWGGYFDPRNLDVVAPEVKFEFTIDEPWAAFRYQTPWGESEGQLGLKGTVDLVVRDKHDPEILEIIDWKTGRRWDWAHGYVKDFKKLLEDPQLLLYYYAFAKHVFPEVPHLQFTIVFINDGGPFRMSFGPEHLRHAEFLLRRKFEQIRETALPKPRYGDHCNFCWFRKNQHPASPGESYCAHFQGEIKQKGVRATMLKWGKDKAWDSYGSGGGRKDTET